MASILFTLNPNVRGSQKKIWDERALLWPGICSPTHFAFTSAHCNILRRAVSVYGTFVPAKRRGPPLLQ